MAHVVGFFQLGPQVLDYIATVFHFGLRFLTLVVVLLPFVLQLAVLAMELSHHAIIFFLKQALFGLILLKAELQSLDVLLLEP